MDKPKECPENSCECLMNIQNAFCVGKSHVTKFYVGGKWHRNDHRFCLISPVEGVRQSLINTDDIDLLARLFLAVRSETRKEFNLNWYFDNPKEMNFNGSILSIECRPKKPQSQLKLDL